ncbi:protein tyrosine kinase, partial [Teladorsagia circumcincta]
MTPGLGTIEEIPPCLNFDVKLIEQGYYHGLLPREDVLYLLQKDGDFLVRITEADTMGTRMEMVLSTLHDPGGQCKPSSGEAVEDDCLKIQLKRPVTLASWEFRTDGFLLGESIGKAGCIEVRKGLIEKEDQKFEASVTTVVGRSAEAKVTISELMRQCRMLRDLHHPCIVRFYGACLISQPCCFLMEYLSEGPLDDFLTKRRGTLKRDEMLQMSMSAGWGLDFLHTAGILHRDIAARNCFYDNQLVGIYSQDVAKTVATKQYFVNCSDVKVKISGFGLARKTNAYVQKSMRRMMIKWMAPETVAAFRFSQKSDVYMYGVLIYEIFSQSEPYQGLSNQEVKPLILGGRVNEFPAKTPKQLAQFVMQKLWHLDPDRRPSMEKALQWLSQYTGIKLQMGTLAT